MKNLFLALMALLAFNMPVESISICNMENDFTVGFATGYRRDKITTFSKSYFPDDTFFKKNDLVASGISVWQVGGVGEWSINDNFFVKAYGFYGFVGSDGDYAERITNAAGESDVTRADIHDGHTSDFWIGTGCIFTFNDFLTVLSKFKPMFGWSTHHQKIQMHHAETSEIPDPSLDKLEYLNRWKGPWVGFDLEAKFCDFNIIGGYEYHFAKWNADWRLNHNETDVGYSDHRHSNNAFGNVFYFTGLWKFLSSWEAALGFKYQHWSAKNGREKQDHQFIEDGIPESDIRTKINFTKWTSWEFDLGVAYLF